MRNMLLAMVGAIAAIATAAGQHAPDLTGTWVMDLTRSDSAVAGGHVPDELQPEAHGETLVIRHTPDALVIERRGNTASETLSYLFAPSDKPAPHVPEPSERASQPESSAVGSTVPNAVGTAGKGNVVPLVSAGTLEPDPGPVGVKVNEARAEVNMDRIVTKLTMLINGKTVTTDETYYLSADGRELTVERELRVHHGYEVVSGSSATGKDVFIRAR